MTGRVGNGLDQSGRGEDVCNGPHDVDPFTPGEMSPVLPYQRRPTDPGTGLMASWRWGQPLMARHMEP